MKTQNYKHPITKLIFLLIICGSFYLAPAQDLTKEETVNYINKKLNDIKGNYITETIYDYDGNNNIEEKKTLYNHSANLVLNDDKIFLTTTWGTMREKYRNYETFKNGEGVTVYVYPCGYVESTRVYSFSLEKIIDIDFYNNVEGESDPIGTIRINTSNKAGEYKRTDKKAFLGIIPREKYYGKCSFWGYPEEYRVSGILLHYLKGDGSDGNKIKKALEYLRDLAKAEDDPFGN